MLRTDKLDHLLTQERTEAYQQEVSTLLDTFISPAPHKGRSQRPLHLDQHFR